MIDNILFLNRIYTPAIPKEPIISGEVIVFAEDECHLVWDDTIGSVLGRRNERTEVPIVNAKKRQTYYGSDSRPLIFVT